MFNKIKNVLYYGGLGRPTYEKYKSYILQQDMKKLRIYLLVTTIGFLMLGAASLLYAQISYSNTRLYFMTAAAGIVLLAAQACLMKITRVDPLAKEALIFLYMAVIYTEAIAVTIQNPDKQAVTFICTMLILPILFTRRPVSAILLQCIATIIFCCFVRKYKVSSTAFIDMWNAVTFLAVSIAAIMIFVPMMMKNLIQSLIIKELNEYDTLTGLKNRNTYEAEYKAHSEDERRLLIVYIDANGLHELNNTKGHAAGDEMLKSIASAVREAFGREYSYRTGGDEFVVIYPGAELLWAKSQVENIKSSVEKAGYSVSVGYAKSEKSGEPLDDVLKRAEAEMYAAKALYYKINGNDRRRR